MQGDGDNGVVHDVIQITDVQVLNGQHLRVQHTYGTGDVSSFLIQQGERERLRKTPSSSSTTAWWWWRSVAILQGFAKHHERRGVLGRGGGLRQNLWCGCPPTPHIYIGARERGAVTP